MTVGRSRPLRAGATSGGCLLLCFPLTTLAGCAFGLDYSGDETGLRRESHAVPGDTGRVLSYLIDGEPTDPRLIFIHGSPGRSSMYAPYMHDPVPGLETVAVDRMGYGESQPDAVVVSFEEQAAAIAPLLVERQGLWPIVVGHSLGGPIAARLAADYPERVGGLIIVAGSLDPDLEDLRWYQKVATWRIIYPLLADFLQQATLEARATRGQVELLEPLLDRIRCPIIIIHGTQDRLVPFEAVTSSIERFAANPNVYVIVLIGEGHSVTKLRGEELRETIAGLRDNLLTPGLLPNWR